MTIFQVKSFVEIYVNKKHFFARKRSARSADPHGSQLRAFSDCFPCYLFVFKVFLTPFPARETLYTF